MSDRLNEALRRTGIAEFMNQEETLPVHVQIVRDAARAYRDILANGERVQPYKAAEKYLRDLAWRFRFELSVDDMRQEARTLSRLLIDPPKEEER